MKEFASNILLALESGDPAIRQSAIRTLEEVIPQIEDKELLSELKGLLQGLLEKVENGEVKESFEKMVEIVESYS